MLSEEKAQRVMGKWIAQCRVNTGNKQKSWKADVVGAHLGVESDLICIARQYASIPGSAEQKTFCSASRQAVGEWRRRQDSALCYAAWQL